MAEVSLEGRMLEMAPTTSLRRFSLLSLSDFHFVIRSPTELAILCLSVLVRSVAGVNLMGFRSNASRARTWAVLSGRRTDESLHRWFKETTVFELPILRLSIMTAILLRTKPGLVDLDSVFGRG